MKFGLPDHTIQKIQAILRNYPQVGQAILYGSRAKGTYKNGSDIDLTLLGEGLALGVLYRILDDIDDLLLPYKVDLSIYETLHDPALLEHIQRVGLPFYQSVDAASGSTKPTLPKI